MSQDDFSIANASGAAVRADLNANLQALASQSSGAAAPSTTYPNQWWMDTTANILKQRDNANTAWINVASKVGTTWIPYRSGTLLGDAATKTAGSAAGQIGLNDQAFADVASATTTDIGAAASLNVRITGTTAITGLGTVASGIRRKVRFAGALTLTHNATSLILPGTANITTAADDTAEFISLGSGNWLCMGYKTADGKSVIPQVFTQSFESAEITLAASTIHTAAHGFGVIPTNVQVVLRCKTAEQGYSIGDEVVINTYYETSTVGGNVGADATNITFIQGGAGYPRVGNKATVISFAPTANWKIVMRGWV